MDFSYSADEERFRGELRAWREANPPGAEPRSTHVTPVLSNRSLS